MTIKPMLLKEIDFDNCCFETYKNWFWQIKENGIRAVIHIKDNKITAIRNRNNIPVLHLFPELKELQFKFSEAILDSEIVVFKDGKSVFYDGINQRSKSLKPKHIREKYPVSIVVFDVLKFEKDIVISKSYKERHNILQENIEDNNLIKTAKNYDGKELWEKIIKDNEEGIVIKNPMAMYEMDSRSSNCIKIKNYKVTDVSVSEVEPNSKGVKIFGTANIDSKEIKVECQFAGLDVIVGDVVKVRYLDVFNSKLIQPHKIRGVA